MIEIIEKKDFDRMILNAPGLNIVRFCADWSGPCQMMGPIYEEMFGIYIKSASFYRIDVDKSPDLKKKLGVVELPTLFFYKNGQVIEVLTGMTTRNLLIEKIEKCITS